MTGKPTRSWNKYNLTQMPGRHDIILEIVNKNPNLLQGLTSEKIIYLVDSILYRHGTGATKSTEAKINDALIPHQCRASHSLKLLLLDRNFILSPSNAAYPHA